MTLCECVVCVTTDSDQLDYVIWDYDGRYVKICICRKCLLEFYEWVLLDMPLSLMAKRNTNRGELFDEYIKATGKEVIDLKDYISPATFPVIDKSKNHESLNMVDEDKAIFDELRDIK